MATIDGGSIQPSVTEKGEEPLLEVLPSVALVFTNKIRIHNKTLREKLNNF